MKGDNIIMRGDELKTLYIDVYFMINFTVDILAIFIALKMVHLKMSIKTLICCGVIGSLLSVVELFVKNSIWNILLTALFLMLISLICAKDASYARKFKFIIAFYIAAFLISGCVNFIYGLIDIYLKDLIVNSAGSTNRKALVFSLIILMMIGVLRLFIMMFSNSINQKSARILIELGGKSIGLDAMIDTGNLVRDPMNMNPVIFIKKSYAKKILPSEIIELSHLDTLSAEYRKRIRLVPVTRNSETHVMTGVRVDRVTVFNGNSKESIDATIVIDKEEGTFGGYYALAPYVAVCNDA